MAELLVSAVPDLRERLVADGIRRAWSGLVGADVARHARPEGVTKGCLHVVVDNSPWLNELTLRAAEISGRVAARFENVRSVRFTLGRFEGAAETSAPPARPRRRTLGPDELREIDASVLSIPDPESRAAARRLLVTARRSVAISVDVSAEHPRGVE